MLTLEQLEMRRMFIGGTDAAAVLGLSRYRTALEVWALKTGALKAEDISQKIPVKLGLKLEQTVAELFVDRMAEEGTPKTVSMPPVDPVTGLPLPIIHPVHLFIGCNLDRTVDGEDAVLECKTASAFKAHEWDEGIPIEYEILCVHQLACTGRARAYLAVLIGNQEFRYTIIERDEKVIADLIKQEVTFWKTFVEPNIMPANVTWRDGGVLDRLFPKADEGSEIELDDKANAVLDSLDALTSDLAAVEGEIERQKNELKVILKGASKGRSNLYQVTWKNQKSGRVDLKKLKLEEPAIYEKYLNADKESRVFRWKKL